MITKIYEKIKIFIKEEWKFILLIVIFGLFTNLRLPYVIETPGGAIDLASRVSIDDAYDQEGSLNMSYVSVVNATPMTMLFAALRSDWDAVPKSDYTLENESYEDSIERNKLYLQEGIANATISAFTLADKYVEVTKELNKVVYIDKKADTDLKVGDILLTINDDLLGDGVDVRELIKMYDVGDTINIKVLRNDKELIAKATLYEEDDSPKVGIISLISYEYETDPEVKVSSKDSESGGSGGLMTALQIYNYITEEDITKGRKIIGTGTINRYGKVGAIDGVKYKLAGAVKEKAEIFLCPIDNLDEALEIKDKHNYNIEIVGVDTLSEAISYLEG